MKKFIGTIFTALVFALTSAAQTTPANDVFQVRQRKPNGPEITPMLQRQVDDAWNFDRIRQQRFAAITNEKEIFALQQEIQNKLVSMIGGLPEERTPLNPKIVGSTQMDAFRIEKLIFESIPGFHVTANVYVPESKSGAKHPAVLVPCGHSMNGKIHYQALCQRLVKQGYLVICWDPVGQGERSQFWNTELKKSRYNLVCGEHAVLGNIAYLAGASLARWEIWDGMRAIDYLLTRADVDVNRISITGTSGGGFQTSHIAALDKRIKVAVPSCYISALPMREFNRIFEDPDSDPEQDVPGMVSNGIDHAGLLLMMYPRPVMVAAAALDFFPIEGTNKTFSEIASLYKRLGHTDRTGFVEGFHKHQYSPENQLAAINFINRFNNLPAIDSLPSVVAIDHAKLLCTSSGQVRVDFPEGKPLLDLIREYAAVNHSDKIATLASLYYNDRYPNIKDWKVKESAGTPSANEITWRKKGTNIFNGITIEKFILDHSAGLSIPLLYMHPQSSSNKKTILWLNIDGKVAADDWSEVIKLIERGFDIISFDFRGTGEDRMNYTATSSDQLDFGSRAFAEAYHSPLSGVMANYVYNSLLNGRPYFLQMMEDVEIVSRFMRAQLKMQNVQVLAKGESLMLAQQIQKIFPDLKAPEKTESLTWANIVDRKIEQWPVEYILPGGAFVK